MAQEHFKRISSAKYVTNDKRTDCKWQPIVVRQNVDSAVRLLLQQLRWLVLTQRCGDCVLELCAEGLL